jgi:hypothetical protein
MTRDKRKQNVFLNDDEKLIFATAVFNAKKNNPDISWKIALDAGRQTLPEHRQIGEKICVPSSLPWLERMLKEICAQTGHDFFKNGATKVFLKPEERELFAKACHQIRKEQPKLKWPLVFEQANEVLPVNRRIGRSFNSTSQISWLEKRLNKLAEEETAATQSVGAGFKAALTDDKIEAPVIPAQGQEVFTPEQPEPERVDLEPEWAGLKPAPTPPDISTLSLETALINAIVSTIKPIVLSIIQSPQFAIGLQQAFRDIAPIPAGSISSHPVIAKAIEQNTATRKKVMIVGLQPIQAQEIQNEWGKVYELRMFDSNVTSEKIKSNLPACERAIIMTKFISHSTMDVMRGHAGFTYCNGGVTALKEILNRRIS